jgi:hypothetical protein
MDWIVRTHRTGDVEDWIVRTPRNREKGENMRTPVNNGGGACVEHREIFVRAKFSFPLGEMSVG